MTTQPVLIVVQGGMAETRYVPEGITVFIKDYDIEGCDADEVDKMPADPDGKKFILRVESPGDDAEARAEAERLLKEDQGA